MKHTISVLLFRIEIFDPAKLTEYVSSPAHLFRNADCSDALKSFNSRKIILIHCSGFLVEALLASSSSDDDDSRETPEDKTVGYVHP